MQSFINPIPKKILVPTLSDGKEDFYFKSLIWNEAFFSSENIIFDFSSCRFLGPNAVVFLGGITRLIQSGNRQVSLGINTMLPKIQMNLQQNGFAQMMGSATAGWQGNSIPYREYLEPNQVTILKYLTDDWLGRGWINISQNLKNEIAGRMWEIFANAFEHSLSKIGLVCCGQYFKNRKELILSVADFGVGIPTNVRTFRGQPTLANGDAMQWAFQKGNSTRINGGPGGVGLDILKEFVRVSKGSLAIYSHGGYAYIDQNEELYDNHAASLGCTLVQVRLRCDDTYYCLSNELNSAQSYF